MKTRIKPLADNLLVKPEKQDKKTRTGIYLPETSAEEQPQEGKVIAIGDSKDIKVKKGDRIIFKKYSGNEVKIDDQAYLIVKNEDILAVIG